MNTVTFLPDADRKAYYITILVTQVPFLTKHAWNLSLGVFYKLTNTILCSDRSGAPSKQLW